jgi:hypothetical protein
VMDTVEKVAASLTDETPGDAIAVSAR